MERHTLYIIGILIGCIFSPCRKIKIVVPSEYELVSDGIHPEANPQGMYLANKGSIGGNRCILGCLDYVNGYYIRNLYSEWNLNMVKELGDVDNNTQIHESKLCVVVNYSHKVGALGARTCERIMQIDIPNCRYIYFYRGNVHVTSYVGPVQIDPNAPQGAVHRVDMTSPEIDAKAIVDYQPDELKILGEYTYVANSGGCRAPEYDNMVSVIELNRFKQAQEIPVGINLHRIRADKYGKLWVTSREDYDTVHSNPYILEKRKGYNETVVIDTLDIPCSNLCISEDSLLYYSTEWSVNTQSNTISYGIIDVHTKEVISTNFITDGSEKDIHIPYGIMVHLYTKDIFVTDTKNYVSSGTPYCYDKNGIRKWGVRTGDIPAHMVFLYKQDSVMRQALYLFISGFLTFLPYTQDKIQIVSLGIDDVCYLPRVKIYLLSPAFTGDEYWWTLHRNGMDSLVFTERSYIFLAKDTGAYQMTFEIIDKEIPYKHDFRFEVMREEIEHSPYLSKVYDSCPVPGQLINMTPECEEGDTKETILKKVEGNISGTNNVMISLEEYGGYVIFGFDYTAINVKGKKDFMILENSFYPNLPEYREKKGDSCEPGIAMASFDTSQNGLPDGEWYELVGSEYYRPEIVKSYRITYDRPSPDKISKPDMSQQWNDIAYLSWKGNQSNTGHLSKNVYHMQSYHLEWIEESTLAFTGTRLRDNATDEGGTGEYYVPHPYPWGYVDNHPNDYQDLSSFDIEWAVDAEGNKVELPGTDPIKVYTAANQYCGWIGETSTEITRAQDLHIASSPIIVPDPVSEQMRL